MKKITKKGFLQKTIIGILLVLCINFIVPTFSHAEENFGGVLFDPICDVLCSIGDAVIYMIEGALTNTYEDGVSLGNGGFLVDNENYWTNQKRYEKAFEESQKKKTVYDENGYEINESTQIDSSETVKPWEEFNMGWFSKKDTYYVPITTYSPEQIFSGKIGGLDINFINPSSEESKANVAATIQSAIASWYVALRNLSVVGLLSVLVYLGIRILISSTASDKAKYKQLLIDWLVALCILFFLHYIMSFTITMTNAITQAINGNGEKSVAIQVEGKKSKGDGTGTIKTNLLGEARFKVQYNEFGKKMTYMIMYLALVIYTVIFTWYYLKRVLMMAFLTIIAPLVALTYPIDKANDGKAQAFNSWIKEYIFNALIQPFHLIIYMVFVGTAMELAEKNVIYMIAALGFIMPAEKILRKFFGFEKAGTLGGLVAATALGTGGAQLAKTLAGGASKAIGKGGGGESSPSDNTKPANPDKGIRYQGSGKGIDGIASADGGPGGPVGPGGPGGPIGDGPIPPGGSGGLDGVGGPGGPVGPIPGTPGGPRPDTGKSEDKPKKSSLAERFSKRVDNFGDGAVNLLNYHTKGIRDLAKNPKRTIRGIAGAAGRGALKAGAGAANAVTRLGRPIAKTAFKAGAGTLAAAVTMAAGGGLAGGMMAFAAGSSAGGKLGDRVFEGARQIDTGLNNGVKAGISGIRKQFDIASGDFTGKKEKIRTAMRDKNNLDYVKQMMEKEGWTDKEGVKHEAGTKAMVSDVKEQMENYANYFGEGLDIEQATKGHKIAEQRGISDDKASKILRYASEEDINKGLFRDEKKLDATKRDTFNEFSKELSPAQPAKETENLYDFMADYHNTTNKHTYSRSRKPVTPPVPKSETTTETPAPKPAREPAPKSAPAPEPARTPAPKSAPAPEPARTPARTPAPKPAPAPEPAREPARAPAPKPAPEPGQYPPPPIRK